MNVAGQSRTSAITISNFQYAGELSKTLLAAGLLDHANKMESVYKKARAAYEEKTTSDKTLKTIS